MRTRTQDVQSLRASSCAKAHNMHASRLLGAALLLAVLARTGVHGEERHEAFIGYAEKARDFTFVITTK